MMNLEQQAIENLAQMAHAFVDSQAAILRNATQPIQQGAGDAQPLNPIQTPDPTQTLEGTSNFA